jgi:hypothetical protein
MRLVNISGTWMCSEVYQRIESAQKEKKDDSGRKLSSGIISSFSFSG